MKNVVFWDIKTQFVPHRRHYVSATEPSRLNYVRFEVVTAVSMKNALFWDIKIQFVPHRKHVSATEPSRLIYVRFEVFTAVTMKNAVFWDVTPFRRNLAPPSSG
jgi:hypothetical protein